MVDLPVIDGVPKTNIVIPWVDLEVDDRLFKLRILQLLADVVIDGFEDRYSCLIVEVIDAYPLRVVLSHEVDHSLGQIRGFWQRVHTYLQSLQGSKDGLAAAVLFDYKLHDPLMFGDFVVLHLSIEFKYN